MNDAYLDTLKRRREFSSRQSLGHADANYVGLSIYEVDAIIAVLERADLVERALRTLLKRGEDPDLAHNKFWAWQMFGGALEDARRALAGRPPR